MNMQIQSPCLPSHYRESLLIHCWNICVSRCACQLVKSQVLYMPTRGLQSPESFALRQTYFCQVLLEYRVRGPPCTHVTEGSDS